LSTFGLFFLIYFCISFSFFSSRLAKARKISKNAHLKRFSRLRRLPENANAADRECFIAADSEQMRTNARELLGEKEMVKTVFHRGFRAEKKL
jgi:hypothetical protein